jgi:hypothetical protein
VDRYQRVEIKNINFSHHSASKWGKIMHGVPQGSILGPLLFLLYTNDLRNFVKDKSKPILFADDTSIIVTNSNPTDFISDITFVFEYLNKWFRANSLSLNFDKTHFMQFTTKNGPQINLDISYANRTVFKADDTKFLGLHVDNTLSGKSHIEQVLYMLNAACYALRSVKPYMSQEILKMVYYAYFHSAISYGIIFWGNSADSTKIFKMQKRAIRIIVGRRNRDSCRALCKNLKYYHFTHNTYSYSYYLW